MRRRHSHWADHNWKLIARVLGSRKGEVDLAYTNEEDLRLLVRLCPSVTERRLSEAETILHQGDFDWILLSPHRRRDFAPPPHIEVVDQATLRARAPSLLPAALVN